MPTTHETNGSAGSPQSHSAETVSPWTAQGISRATYFRRRQANKSEIQEPNKQIAEPKLEPISEPEIVEEIRHRAEMVILLAGHKAGVKAIEFGSAQGRRTSHTQDAKLTNAEPKLEPISEPEIKSDEPANNKPHQLELPDPIPAEAITAERKIAPDTDEATNALKARIAEMDRSAELVQQQRQANEINAQINQIFNFWQQAGASIEQQHIFRADPAFMVRLTEFAHNEASKLHQVNSPEYFEAGKRLFFEHLDHLQQQAKQHAQQSAEPIPAADNEPAMTEPTPKFFEPVPAPSRVPRQQQPARTSLYSAPVSREMPGSREFEANDPRSVRLNPDQVEAARIAGVDLKTYATMLVKMKRMKRDGSFNSQ
jgi:hypothetical protein